MPQRVKIKTSISIVEDVVLEDDDVLDDVLEEYRESDSAMGRIESAIDEDIATITTEVVS